MASILKVDTIQDQSGNNIINENADTITIGASGDTITIPSGATLSSTDPSVFSAGTESLPAITTTGDLDTGIYFPAADTIAFSTNGDETVRIASNGVFTVNRGKSTNGGLLLLSKNAISVSTSATNISATNSYGSLAFVWGLSGGNIFHDLVSWSLSQVDVLASQNISGGPAGRTYSASSGVLRVAMASGTYDVYESDIRTQTS